MGVILVRVQSDGKLVVMTCIVRVPGTESPILELNLSRTTKYSLGRFNLMNKYRGPINKDKNRQ